VSTLPGLFDPTDNPFNLAYRSLWDMLTASKAVNKLVRPGNMIKYHEQSAGSPAKDEVSQADLPELILVANTLKGGIRTTSDTSEATLGLQWVISTGDPSVARGLLPVMFAVYAALVKWPGVAQGIQWRNGTPIKRVDLLESNLGLTDLDRNRGIAGWSAVWSVEVLLVYNTQDALDFANALPFTS